MEHAREIDLIEFVAGRLDAERQKAVSAHLQDCPACRAQMEGIASTWDILGAWEVRPSGHVDVAKLAVQSALPGTSPAGSALRFPGVREVMRIAALIAVTALVGYAGGRWSVRPVNTGVGTQAPQYMSVLGLEIGASFSPLVLEDEPSPGQEG